MPWDTSTRASRLPSDWSQRRADTRDRAGGICQWVESGVRCTAPGRECDHIHPGDDHSPANLQWLCSPHHRLKTKRESAAARWKYREHRPAERHPGLR
jgi:5-methylcytosine-specific restriction endonuclease McrA